VNVSSRISTAGTSRIGTSCSPSVAWRGRSDRALTGADTLRRGMVQVSLALED
jgi:hypothetical protein